MPLSDNPGDPSTAEKLTAREEAARARAERKVVSCMVERRPFKTRDAPRQLLMGSARIYEASLAVLRRRVSVR